MSTTLFNPTTKGVPRVAKFWELLRRNPDFREDLRLIIAAKKSNFKAGITRKELEEFLFVLDYSNPLAALCFRWVFPATMFSFGKTPPGTDPTELIANYLPYLSTEQAHHCLRLYGGVDKFYKFFPFMLNRRLPSNDDPNLGLGTYLPKGTARPPLLGTKAFSEIKCWSETPKAFQQQFEWLWAFRYDYSAVSPFTNDRFLLPKITFPLLLLQIYDQCSSPPPEFGRRMKNQLEHLMDTHVILAIPRMLMTKAVLKTAVGWLEENLKSNIVHGNGEFLGGEEAWKVFIEVMDSREYMPSEITSGSEIGKLGSKRKWQTTGTGVILEGLASAYSGKMKPHLQKRLHHMEDLMSRVYPVLYDLPSTQSTSKRKSPPYVLAPFICDTDPFSDFYFIHTSKGLRIFTVG